MRNPDMKGPAGRAWVVTEPDPAEAAKYPAHVVAYLAHVPGAHPFWSWYLVACCDLADHEGQPAAVRDPRKPDATHEISVWALDPDGNDTLDPDQPGSLHGRPMTPPNAVCQFQVPGSAEARKIAELLTLAFVRGQISPDEDYHRAIVGAIEGTAAHFRDGTHTVQ